MDVRAALLTVAFVVAVLVLPSPASTATCSQYPNQAATQLLRVAALSVLE